MPSATNPDPGPPFETGRALALSLSILGSNAGALALMTVLIHLPALAYQFFVIAVPTVVLPAGAAATDALAGPALRAQQQQAAILTGVGMFFTALATAAVIHRIFQQIQGNEASFVGSLRFGLRRVGAVLLINFLTGLLTFLGCLAFFVPGFVIATMLFVAVPVSVAEGRDIFDSLRRSADLTRGSRWGIFGLLIIPTSFVAGLNLAAILALGETRIELALANPRFQAVSAVIAVLYQALASVTTTVAYLELRRRREGSPTPPLVATPD